MNNSKKDLQNHDRKFKTQEKKKKWILVTQFILTLLGIPLCVLLLPFSIISRFITKYVIKNKIKILEPGFFVSPPVIVPLADREYDIVLFGATGFTGKLAAEYLAKNYFGKLRWAIAGRNRQALEAVRKMICEFDDSLKDLPILVCDSSKTETLIPVVNSTRVVVSTVGPFALYGTPLVALCATFGTSYCDITGESEWVRKTIFHYYSVARKTGARIIHMAGNDCIPWDISTWAIANKLKETNENLTEINFYDELRSSPSGGTIETVIYHIDHPEKPKYPFDPLLQMQDGSLSLSQMNINNAKYPGWVTEYEGGRWVGPFVMASVNANCVRRSNAIFGYSKKLVYRESRVFGEFFNVFVDFFGFVFIFIGMTCLPIRWLLTKYLLPKPGSGPSKSEMDKGFLKVTGFGVGDKGTKVKTMLYFPTDPGYRDTARMVVETGLALAFDTEKIKIGGGIWTPACLGEVLLGRLVETGCTFTIQSI